MRATAKAVVPVAIAANVPEAAKDDTIEPAGETKADDGKQHREGLNISHITTSAISAVVGAIVALVVAKGIT